MKPRPRQIDNSKAFILIENFEKFKQEEGHDNDSLQTHSIITPILLDPANEMQNLNSLSTIPHFTYNLKKTSYSKIQIFTPFLTFTILIQYQISFYLINRKVPQLHKIEQLITAPQSPQPFKRIRPEFCHYKYEPYPDGFKYELNEENLKFLQILNEKYSIQVSITPFSLFQIPPEDFQRYIEVLDLKSGKDTILDFSSSFTMLTRELPSTITRLSDHIQSDLHTYWKQAREELKRPFLRSIMHPDFDDTNPHLAFRSRNPPQERKIYTRGRNPQTKSFSEMETMSNRVIGIKEDLMRAQELFQKILVRERGFEIDRRVSFLKFIKEVATLHHSNFNPAELTIWNKDCFLDFEIDAKHQKKETNLTVVNIVKNESNVKSEEASLSKICSLVKSDIEMWKRSEENQVFRSDLLMKLENDFKLITQKHRQAISAPHIEQDLIANFNEMSQMVRPRPLKQRIHDEIRENKDFMNREYIEERRDSVAKYISTVYLEGRKLGLMLDKVLNQTESLTNFIPMRAEPLPPIQKQINVTQVKGRRESSGEVALPTQKSDFVKFVQVKIGGFLYRLPSSHFLVEKLKRKFGFQEQLSLNPLKKYKIIQKRADKLVEMADIDQMLYSEQIDDEKHEEEQFKIIKKRLRAYQSKFIIPNISTNGIVKYN